MAVLRSIPKIVNRHFVGCCDLFELQVLKDGCTYLTKDNYVVKEAKSDVEYEIAQTMKGYHNMHIVDIYDCYEENGRYFILEECLPRRLDFNMLLRFSDSYRTSWARPGYYSEMRDIVVKGNQRKEEKVLDMFKELTNNDKYFEQLFHDTCTAIIELYCLTPKVWLDTNATNIGFTKGNIMKYFDIELAFS